MKRRTALVVDDDDGTRELLSLMMEQLDFRVLGAKTGQSALDVVRNTWLDIVLLDIRMPGVSGLDVLQAIQTRPGRKPPIIMTTASGDRADVVRALELGAASYILKPVQPQLLRARVMKQFASETGEPAAILDDESPRALRR